VREHEQRSADYRGKQHSGNVTDEVWRKYIEEQRPETPDDHFKVV